MEFNKQLMLEGSIMQISNVRMESQVCIKPRFTRAHLTTNALSLSGTLDAYFEMKTIKAGPHEGHQWQKIQRGKLRCCKEICMRINFFIYFKIYSCASRIKKLVVVARKI